MHMGNSSNVWRIPFACQLVPAGMMLLGLLTDKVSFLDIEYIHVLIYLSLQGIAPLACISQ